MPRNYDRDESLVYIRRTSNMTGVRSAGGIIGNWEYYHMTSLPTNDNPRYSASHNNIDQDIISSYYFKIKTGPSDIKIQTSPYPQVSGYMDENDNIVYISPEIIAKVELSDGSFFYSRFPTETGKAVYDHIPYRYYQLGFKDADVAPYKAADLIHGSGDVKVRFKRFLEEGTEPGAFDFDTLPDLPPFSGNPKVVEQTGIMKLQSKFPYEIEEQRYKLIQPEKYEYMSIESLEKYDINDIKLTPHTGIILNPYVGGTSPNGGNNPVLVDSGIVIDLKGVYPPWGLTAYHQLEKRREAGSQIKKIPLHEITNQTQRVGCNATHVAYRIGHVDKAASDEYFSAPLKPTAETDHKILRTPQPSVYLFMNSAGFYSRRPECWPWSCRRWTVEKSGEIVETKDTNGKVTDSCTITHTKYYTQNENGYKEQVEYDQVPSLKIDISSFLGDEKSFNPKILNGDPLETLDVTTGIGGGSCDESKSVQGDPESFIAGTYMSKMEVYPDSEMEHIQCGCNPDDEKVELAFEMYPYLNAPTCSLIMKLGYLCYPTKKCTIPNLGRATKKIIYPFNACKFNEKLEIDLLKTDFPGMDISNESLEFEDTPDTTVAYLYSGSVPVYADPFEHPSGVQISIDGGATIDLTSAPAFEGEIGHISLAAGYPCKYTSDIRVYRIESKNIGSVPTIVPLNTVFNCENNNLGEVTVIGNGTDVYEDDADIITGGDYYYSEGVRTLWNKIDQPKMAEIYPAKSLGNGAEFINIQAGCCEYCKKVDVENGIVFYFSNPNCFHMDLEGMPGSGMDQYSRVGDCEVKYEKPCDATILKGRSKLRVLSTIYADPGADARLDVSGTMKSRSVIRVHGSGTLSSYGGTYGTGILQLSADSLMQTRITFGEEYVL